MLPKAIVFLCFYLNTLCVQMFIRIAHTTCELHCLTFADYNVMPGAICCCIMLIYLVTQISMTGSVTLLVSIFLQNFMLISF